MSSAGLSFSSKQGEGEREIKELVTRAKISPFNPFRIELAAIRVLCRPLPPSSSLVNIPEVSDHNHQWLLLKIWFWNEMMKKDICQITLAYWFNSSSGPRE